MALEALDHYTVLTDDVEASTSFYEGALGLRQGARPDFGFPGAWLYIGDIAVLHLIGRGAEARATGPLDHIAFRCQGYRDTKRRLEEMNIEHEERTVPGVGLRQVFVEGPEGVKIELIFQPEDVARDSAA